MKRMINLFCLLALTLTLTLQGSARAHEDGNDAARAFTKLKRLVGEWEAATSDGTRATLRYDLVSGGTALLETSHEVVDSKPTTMVTVYFLDRSHLLLTHYCSANNQPTMKAISLSPDTETITFNFISATNLSSLNDGHLHHLVIHFSGNDHFTAERRFQRDQRDALRQVLICTRVH